MNPCFKAALEYLELYKLSVIPCKLFFGQSKIKAEKKPLVSWKTYQQRLPTQEELFQWWKQWPNAQVGIVTGGISGVVIIDLDIGYDKNFIQTLGLLRLPACTPAVMARQSICCFFTPALSSNLNTVSGNSCGK